MGLKSQKFYVFFPCNPMEPFISGVHPHLCMTSHFSEVMSAGLRLPSLHHIMMICKAKFKL